MTRWLIRFGLLGLGAATGLWIAGHYLGFRFAMGIWPVPAGTPWTYQFESGFLPALTVMSLVTLVAGAWHHVNCHESRCWRVGRHKIDGTPWCNRHHEQARQLRHDRSASLDDLMIRLDKLIELLERR